MFLYKSSYKNEYSLQNSTSFSLTRILKKIFSNYLRNIGKDLFKIYIIYFERFLITKLIYVYVFLQVDTSYLSEKITEKTI